MDVGITSDAGGMPGDHVEATSTTRSHEWVAVVVVTALAAALRMSTLSLQSYDFDEGWTVEVIHGSFAHLARGVASSESTPPLYYLLAWAWAKVFGTSEAALRSLSALAGVASVPIVFAVARTLASRRVALVASLIVATSPYLVFYSQEARAYSLFVLLTAATLFFCVRVVQRPSPRFLTWWVVTSILALATHYFAALVVAGQLIALAVFGVTRRALAVCTIVIGVAVAPLAVLADHQAAGGHTDWIRASSLLQRLRVTAETFTLGATFKGDLPHRTLLFFGLCALLIAFGIIVAVCLLVLRTDQEERHLAVISVIVMAVVVVAPVIAALGPADYVIHKNLIPVLPLAALSLAAGLGARRAGRLGTAGSTAIIVTGILLTVASFAAPSLRRADVREAARQLGPARARAIVFIPRWQLLLEEYQRSLTALPASGADLTEIDVFTIGDTLPAGTVPPGFHLAHLQHGNTFTVFTFRSTNPVLVTPKHLAQHLFDESDLQPIALLQR